MGRYSFRGPLLTARGSQTERQASARARTISAATARGPCKSLLNPSQSSPRGIYQRETGRTPILGETARGELRKKVVEAVERPSPKHKIVIMNRAAQDGQVESLITGQMSSDKWEASTAGLMGTQAITALPLRPASKKLSGR